MPGIAINVGFEVMPLISIPLMPVEAARVAVLTGCCRRRRNEWLY